MGFAGGFLPTRRLNPSLHPSHGRRKPPARLAFPLCLLFCPVARLLSRRQTPLSLALGLSSVPSSCFSSDINLLWPQPPPLPPTRYPNHPLHFLLSPSSFFLSPCSLCPIVLTDNDRSCCHPLIVLATLAVPHIRAWKRLFSNKATA